MSILNNSKTCTSCGRYLDLRSFALHKAGKQGRASQCRTCKAREDHNRLIRSKIRASAAARSQSPLRRAQDIVKAEQEDERRSNG